MRVDEMTAKQLRSLPVLNWSQALRFDSLVLLPTKRIHDSGFPMMDFVPCAGCLPLGRFSGGTDSVRLIPSRLGYQIDLLPRSGMVRLFVRNEVMENGPVVSSLNIYPREKDPTP